MYCIVHYKLIHSQYEIIKELKININKSNECGER